MSSSGSSFGEMELLRFMFEINQQPVDNLRLQQMIFEHQMRNQLYQSTVTPPPEALHPPTSPIARNFNPQTANTSTPSTVAQIPEPKVVFTYAPTIPTPATTPEPESVKPEPNDLEHLKGITEWTGKTIYHKLPDIAVPEFDKILCESHMIKAEVVEMLHKDSPINYDYNPNKSRIRTNYENPSIAEGRTKNNIASRRSRQRKKFFQHILLYSLEFDEDENFLLAKQKTWLQEIIENLEKKVVEENGEKAAEDIEKLKQECGF